MKKGREKVKEEREKGRERVKEEREKGREGGKEKGYRKERRKEM